MILSRHGTRNLLCKFPKSIYYSKLLKQQRKKKIKYASRHKNEELQEDQNEDTGRLWMYIHRNG